MQMSCGGSVLSSAATASSNPAIQGTLLSLAFLLVGQAAISQGLDKPGAKAFQSHCAACHQYDGQGVGEAPPLDQNEWVNGPEERLVKIVLHGVRGRMEVQGRIYDREMPGVGATLPDKELADLLSFVRATFGKPSSPISEQTVLRIRQTYRGRVDYWTVDELLGGK